MPADLRKQTGETNSHNNGFSRYFISFISAWPLKEMEKFISKAIKTQLLSHLYVHFAHTLVVESHLSRQ